MCKKQCGIGIVSAGMLVALFGAGLPANAATFEVTLQGTSFMYDGQSNMDIDLTIDPGDTVRWLWVSGSHNVASGSPGDPDQGTLFLSGVPTNVPDTTFEFTFTDPGSYAYHCHVHGGVGMISSVTVTGPVPTLSEWGMAVMTLLLITAGTLVIASRRATPVCVR